jgi:ABC-type Fe3+-siderophore transport system permease subunit
LKTTLWITLLIAGSIGAAALLLRACDVSIPWMNAIDAALLAVTASIAGMLPLVLSRHTDMTTLMQRALMGTAIHMFVAAGVAIALLVSHSPETVWPLIFWLFGGYVISLLAVVLRSQRVIAESAQPGDGERFVPAAGTR